MKGSLSVNPEDVLLAIAKRKSKVENRSARVAKLADAPDLGSGGEILRGSSPLPGILLEVKNIYRIRTRLTIHDEASHDAPFRAAHAQVCFPQSYSAKERVLVSSRLNISGKFVEPSDIAAA